MSDLTALRKRVEEATGADRELDGAIHNAMFGTAYVRSNGSVTGFMTSETDNGNPSVPTYTASVDAALALVERLLPGTALESASFWPVMGVDETDDNRRANVKLLEVDPDGWARGARRHKGAASTLPLAILAALLSALEQSNG